MGKRFLNKTTNKPTRKSHLNKRRKQFPLVGHSVYGLWELLTLSHCLSEPVITVKNKPLAFSHCLVGKQLVDVATTLVLPHELPNKMGKNFGSRLAQHCTLLS
jgi:hypothetical protein